MYPDLRTTRRFPCQARFLGAGGYRVEGRGQALFERIDGDRSAIQGLPMARLVRLLREAGVRFFV